MAILVTGGAGYIGSHVVRDLQRQNFEVVVLDNFSTGNRWAIDNCEILEIDLLDIVNLTKLLKKRKFKAVFHFAAKSVVKESEKYPLRYYHNNISGTLNLIKVMLNNNNNNLIFSSTAAIYGIPATIPVSEDDHKQPINHYGKSKYLAEQILFELQKKYQMNIICYRYFNASGADKSLEIGESRSIETHLIPNIFKSITTNSYLKVFGKNYDTPDGTCIRDYVHVSDISQGHILGLNLFKNKCIFENFNLGSTNGFSVLDIIKETEKITSRKVQYQFFERRKGDPSVLIANANKAKQKLKWKPKFSKLDKIIKSSWDWHLVHDGKQNVTK